MMSYMKRFYWWLDGCVQVGMTDYEIAKAAESRWKMDDTKWLRDQISHVRGHGVQDLVDEVFEEIMMDDQEGIEELE